MISFNYETEFELHNEADFSRWLSEVILSENKKEGGINYIFCDDDYLLSSAFCVSASFLRAQRRRRKKMSSSIPYMTNKIPNYF